MRYLAPLLALLPQPLGAEVLFRPADPLPVPHIYSGEWEHFVGGGVAILDCNGSGRPDLFVAGGAGPAALLINRTAAPGDPLRFEPAEIAPITGVTGAYPLDIDGDGHLDLAVLRVGPNLLLRGNGDCRFEDASDAWGFHRGDAWSTAFSATWEQGRAWPTLAIGNYVDRRAPDGPFGACDVNELHRPSGKGFAPPQILSPGYCALSMLISDWQRNGRPQLRISNDRHYYIRGGYEEMWRLEPLEPRGSDDGWPLISLWGMGIASRDITGNGFPDVMLTSMGDQLLQFNDGTHYVNAPYEQGSAAQRPWFGDDGRPSTGWHAEFGDVNNDGLADLFIAKGNVDQMPSNAMKDPNNLLIQEGDGRFAERADTAGVASLARARGAGLADLDGDGRLDLVVVNRRAPLEIWQNVSSGTGNWVAVTPRMEGPNRNAVGAWVELRTAGRTQVQEVTVGGGHGSGQAGPLHFGLGDHDNAELRVLWPDGRLTDWHVVPVNQSLQIAPD
ncbi:CRTAC1 family protein [Plastorhodobacter daqingensis]|uniref:CRTAC1 family protein n=1 Tax=Plastorhodobacter daqingensis TaxID=1387281 RepID=A0ABW2UPI9_9RHOB